MLGHTVAYRTATDRRYYVAHFMACKDAHDWAKANAGTYGTVVTDLATYTTLIL